MIDLFIYESKDGGELCLSNNDIVTVDGLVNQVYIALFGGNIESETETEDVVLQEQRFDWWGNTLLDDSDNRYNSNFEQELMKNNLSISGIQKLENIVKKDLEFLEKYANIEVEAQLYLYNRLELLVKLQRPGKQEEKMRFLWDGTKKDLELDKDCITRYADLMGIDYDIINDTLIVY